MAPSSGDDFVVLVCTNPNPTEPHVLDEEILISTNDIHSWNISTILRHQTVKIQANRNMLIQKSSYFRGLLSGSFSESCLKCISIEWDLKTFLNILKFIYGCSFDVMSDNFLPLFEGALYFGVETLLLKCKNWFSEVSSAKVLGPPQMQLDDLIHVWNFGGEHVIDFLPELCASYLARNFMWVMGSEIFRDVPYNLLSSCIKHHYLTVESEMHVSDALLIWLNARTEHLECRSLIEAKCSDILEQIRISLLPLWFAAGKRRSCYFSKLAGESVSSTLRLIKVHPTSSINDLGDGDLSHLRIRLTEFSETVDLSGCPQITSAILLLSVLPSSYSSDPTLRKSIKQSLINLEHIGRGQGRISPGLPQVMSFEAVDKVDISKCSRLHLEAGIECFAKAFPSLRILKAAYLLNFKTTTLCKLVQKCPMIREVDITVDPTPVIPTQMSVVSSKNVSIVGNNSLEASMFYQSGPSFSKITKLSLDGRSDISDLDLQYISKFFVSLQYINLKGCISVTDVCISNLLRSCIKLKSVIVCDTSFGMNSILALCSSIPNFDSSSAVQFGMKQINSLASNLQALHIGGCKNIDEASLVELMSHTQVLKSFCLRDNCLVDNALYNFSGSSLEMLDISNTMVSGGALAHIVYGNPGLKSLNARGCKNLFQLENNSEGVEFSSPYSSKAVFIELGRRCRLEEIALGWGFSHLSLEPLKPAIMSLRSITVGLGGSLGEDALRLLPSACPMLESVTLYFQVISDCVMMDIMASLRHLKVLALCYCLGDISISSFKCSMPNLRKLRLERVAHSMTNDDLIILTQTCMNLVDLSLLGCPLLNSDSQYIISHGWPGLTSLHLEDCGEVTARGVSYLFDCTAVEDLLLRHNGSSVPKNFILEATSKMAMLRKLSLDLCDAIEGDFDIPEYADRYSLSTVKIARCKSQRCGLPEACRRPVHKETLVLAWNSKNLTRTVVRERL